MLKILGVTPFEFIVQPSITAVRYTKVTSDYKCKTLFGGLLFLFFFPSFQIVLDLCNPNPCQQGAPCHSIEGRYICACPEGYLGNECMTLKNPCIGQHCSGNTICESVLRTVKFLCICFSHFFCLQLYRRHVRHNTQSGQLLHHPCGCTGVGGGLRLCQLYLHLLPPSSKAEKAAGCPTGRGHQQPEGVCQPDSKRGPSCAPPAACPHARTHSCPGLCPAMLRGD